METPPPVPATIGDTKSCPVCGETIKQTAIKCRFCGEDLEAFTARREGGVEKMLYAGRPAALYSIGRWSLAIVTLGIAALFYRLASLSTRFEITTQRVRIERGVLSRTKQDTELFRIDDISIEQPVGMRLVGHGILVLRSTDRTTPEIRLYGIPGFAALADQLRECAMSERERRGVRVWAKA